MLSTGLDVMFGLLNPSGRLAAITFHSLEDRMVKQRLPPGARDAFARRISRSAFAAENRAHGCHLR